MNSFQRAIQNCTSSWMFARAAFRTFSRFSGVLVVLEALFFHTLAVSINLFTHWSINFWTGTQPAGAILDCSRCYNNRTASKKVSRHGELTLLCRALYVRYWTNWTQNARLRPFDCIQPHSQRTNGRYMTRNSNKEVPAPHPLWLICYQVYSDLPNKEFDQHYGSTAQTAEAHNSSVSAVLRFARQKCFEKRLEIDHYRIIIKGES